MDLQKLLIFFFSALGAFNGLLLSFYIASIARKKHYSYYFLTFLLLSLSVRIVKSSFFYFLPQLSVTFIQIGLSACALIGPFLYLFLKSNTQGKSKFWAFHVFSYLIAMIVLGIMFPYWDNRSVWGTIVKIIYTQWAIYLLISLRFVLPLFIKIFKRVEKITHRDLWLISIYVGVFIVWLAYFTSSYTSYIVGAISFSFVLYLIVLFFVFRNKKEFSFVDEKIKYKGKKIDQHTLEKILTRIDVVKTNRLYLNPNLTLSDVAKELHVSNHIFSQYLNDNLNKSFSTFINELRIEKAKELLIAKNPYTIENIGYDCGFNSKSSFFTAFKKITKQTPSNYQKINKR